MSLPKRDRRCHLVIAYAPDDTTMREANTALNDYVADKRRGLALFHDHFTDRPGGIAVFDVETPEHLDALQDPGPLGGWKVVAHPLIYADGAARFLNQVDYTLETYRGRKLAEFLEAPDRSSATC